MNQLGKTKHTSFAVLIIVPSAGLPWIRVKKTSRNFISGSGKLTKRKGKSISEFTTRGSKTNQCIHPVYLRKDHIHYDLFFFLTDPLFR